ncbi:Prominin-1-A [Papilio xuthus]|uniref:Prominin-1-A n=1 Tax=Papilio xuthus TaxID=66420 RepID=A0A194PLI5_PAPXU|nr:Prominin-1-A [Papilio xuthus]
MKMSAILLMVIIFITNGAKLICLEAKSDAVSEVKFKNSYSEDVFQQMRTTSEITPAASTGNKVNDVASTASSKSLEAQEENFLAISPITSSGKNSIEEKNNEVDEGNDELLKTSELTATKQNKTENPMYNINLRKNINLPPPLNIIWENCLESAYREHNKLNFKPQRQLEVAKNLQVYNDRIGGNVWDKRDVEGTKSIAIKAWLDKYNNLKNAKKKTGQSNETMHANDVSILAKTTKPVTYEIFSITKEISNEHINSINSTLSSTVTENDIRASNSIEWFEEMDQSKIKFSSLPQMQNYLVPKFKLEEGFHPFTFVAHFFSVIYPFDFPIGLAKDVIWGQVTFPLSFIQSIKVESTFLAFIVLFACIALIIPTYLIILAIIYLLSKSSCSDEAETGALFPDQDGSSCIDNTLISGMVLSNEQSHVAAMSSRNVVNCACADIATWLSVAARELHYSLVPPIDLVLYAYQEDLRNVDTFLGEPIQQAIASESGIDLVLDSLADIIAESEDLSSKVSALRNISIKAGTLAAVAADRLDDLARQIDGLKKQCSPKDGPLCDTINTHSMELKLKFNSILKEQQLLELRALGVDNLTLAIASAKQELRTLPSIILTQTKEVRDISILRDIEIRRDKVHSSARILSDIVRYLTAGLHSFSRQLDASFERIQIYEFWRWIFMLVCTVVCALVMMLMLAALLCGCGRAKIHAKRTLQLSAVWICFASLLLWSVISAVFLIAGHAEVFVCQTLWDSAQYKTLSKLLDRPSPLLQNNEGFFDAMFRDLDNVTIEVSVRDALRDCERNRPAYVVFQLDRILDVNKETSYFEWEELQADLGRLSTAVDVSFLKSISAPFNRILNEILVKSNVNLPLYRMEYNNPVVGKDLPALEDQLENVAAQVSDLTTSGRLETLAKRTERVYVSNIKPLEQLRADLVFKLTELELQLIPYRRRLNISLSHIHTAQFYIDNQGDVIAQKKVSAYVSRLVSHAARWRSHVLTSTGKHAARCQPLFAVYAAVRALLCTNYISSLLSCLILLFCQWFITSTAGGFAESCWVCCGAYCLLLCAIKLWRTYARRMSAQDFITLSNFNTAPQGTPETEPCENGNWATPGSVPGPPPPPRDDNW